MLDEDVHAPDDAINNYHKIIDQTTSNNVNANEKIEIIKEGMKHGALQNITVGDGEFDSLVEMVTRMQDLPCD